MRFSATMRETFISSLILSQPTSFVQAKKNAHGTSSQKFAQIGTLFATNGVLKPPKVEAGLHTGTAQINNLHDPTLVTTTQQNTRSVVFSAVLFCIALQPQEKRR